MQQRQLILLIGAPRSGTTLLQRMLGAHHDILAFPEPHVLLPLAYLGYYGTVDAAPFDHLNASRAVRAFCDYLPNGEERYLAALRASSDTLYRSALAKAGKTLFVDKTPAYSLILPFLTKLYPDAWYVVITRHPLAILHSYAHSFFAGDYQAAYAHQPIVERFVPAIGAFLRQSPVAMLHLQYEQLTAQPAASMAQCCQWLQLAYNPNMVHYGNSEAIPSPYGDPKSVAAYEQPVTAHQMTWADDLAARPSLMPWLQSMVGQLADEDLQAWGYPRTTFWQPLAEREGKLSQLSAWDRYRLQRRLLGWARKGAKQPLLGQTLRQVRWVCDMLLRDQYTSASPKPDRSAKH